MQSNYEYLKEFVEKHKYRTSFKVQCFRTVGVDSIKSVIFDKKDVPSGKKISMEDIRYDIDSSFPEDVFYRYLEFCDANPDKDVSYIYWMTQMDNKYVPMGIDKSESEKLKKVLYESLNNFKKLKWI